MYTRSRQNQNFTGGTPQRNQGNQQQQQYQGSNYNNHGNYQGGQNQNAFNKQQQQQQGGGNNTPYKQQQQQPQTPQRNNPQQVKQQSPQQQQQSNQQQQQAPTPQRLKPILKSSSQTNVQQQQQQQQQPSQQAQQGQNQNFNQQQQSPPNNGMDTNETPSENADSDVQDVPKWKRKGPGVKINKKLKRLRLNQRLRKTLQPKNAIMVLNEMKTGVHFTFPEQQTSLPNALFLVHAEIEGKTYVGQGVSKPLARQNAAENALKSLLLEKMTAAAMKASVDAENETSSTNSLVSGVEESENKEGETMIAEPAGEDPNEIPWSSLASFALYKLFLEWQNQGTVVPVPRPGISTGKVKKDVNKPIVPKELPPNPTTIHPVMLLNQMRPGLIYTEVSRVGNPPNITFTLGVDVDGQEYTGTAKNKKDAKKLAAKAALFALYNLVYPDEAHPSEDVNIG